MKKINKKRGQEEMVGFALIIILVSVILLAFLGISLSKSESEIIESFQVENFLQASLQYTTECKVSSEPLSIQDLIFECSSKEQCLNGQDSCEVLNSTLTGLLKESWQVGEDSPYQGYELTLVEKKSGFLIPVIESGLKTSEFKGANQPFARQKKDFEVQFRVYF